MVPRLDVARSHRPRSDSTTSPVLRPDLVVALPSTVHGHSGIAGRSSLLLARRQVIAIEEHIAPVRPDGLVQTPNIIDDWPDLRRLYRYLRGRSVWHATGQRWLVCRSRASKPGPRRTARGILAALRGPVERPQLTLFVECAVVCTAEQPLVEITTPDGVAWSLARAGSIGSGIVTG